MKSQGIAERVRVGASEVRVVVLGSGLLPSADTTACCCCCSSCSSRPR